MSHRPLRARRDRSVAALVAIAALLTIGAAVPPGAAPAGRAGGRTSLPSVDSGPLPGPALLYAKPPRAPQLQNTGFWHADPILVSGAQAYRDGEWLYQDFLYDDHGATGVRDPEGPYGPGDHLYSPPGGTFTYPRDPVYANNAADLVELRLRPLKRDIAFRVTLNTLIDPTRTAFTLALGDDGSPVDWPHGAGVASPAEVFVTVHGETAEALDAATGEPTAVQPRARLDLERRQIEVRLPRAAWDPRDGTERVRIGVGLWDPGAGGYLAPEPGEATETTPGGGTPQGVAIVNVGPRFDEPWPVVMGATMADTAVGATALASWWRERQQSLQLARGDVTPFAAAVDFGKLARFEDDDSAVPTSGPMNRILASRFSFGQGVDPSEVCFEIGGVDRGASCVGRFVGQLQAYSLYVPEGPPPERGYGLTLLLHSLSANYNQYSNTRNQSQLGERGAGSLVVTPGGRGPDGFYAGYAEADLFETWADVARHYPVDPEWVTVSGYSMGGFGTYRMLARWPDLFARGFSVVGVPGSAMDQLPSLRHTPVLAWNATADELVHLTEAEEAHEALTAAGIRHIYDLFLNADHLTLAGNDEYRPGAEWLGEHRVDRSPARVTYVVDPSEDNAAAGVVADHAYWLSEVAIRDPEASPTGTIDVWSAASGHRDGEPSAIARGGGVLTGGFIPAMTYVERRLEWGPPQEVEPANRLEVTATNVRHVTIDVRRAGVTCGVEVEVETDGPLTIHLPGCDRTVEAR